MKIRRSILLLALAVGLAVLAAMLIETQFHQLRFDGVYISRNQRDVGGDLYLRFYKDGTALWHIGGYGSTEQEAMHMHRGSRWVEHGRYVLKDRSVSGSVEDEELTFDSSTG